MKEERVTAEILKKQYPVDREKADKILAKEAGQNRRKLIVLDDDPTGVQTVHDISVYTDWTLESIRNGFAEENNLFFILTNSRGLTEEQTTRVHTELAERVEQVAYEFDMDDIII